MVPTAAWRVGRARNSALTAFARRELAPERRRETRLEVVRPFAGEDRAGSANPGSKRDRRAVPGERRDDGELVAGRVDRRADGRSPDIAERQAGDGGGPRRHRLGAGEKVAEPRRARGNPVELAAPVGAEACEGVGVELPADRRHDRLRPCSHRRSRRRTGRVARARGGPALAAGVSANCILNAVTAPGSRGQPRSCACRWQGRRPPPRSSCRPLRPRRRPAPG